MLAHRAAPSPHSLRVFHRGSHVIAFREQENADYEQLVALLLSEYGRSGEVSRRTVQSQLDDGIFLARSPLALNDQARAILAASHVLNSLGRPVCEWRAHFHVVGLYDECLPFTFGTARFFPSGTSLWPMVAPSAAPENDLMEAVRRDVRRNIEEHFGGHEQWAQVSVYALEHDSEAALELGLAELKLLIEVLNFYGDIFRPAAYRSRIEIADQAGDGLRKSCAVMRGGEPGGVATTVTRPLDNMWLPELDSDEAAEAGLSHAHRILSRPHVCRTGVERRIVSALRWAGRASVAQEPTDQLLLFMTALEALVNDDNRRVGVAATVETRTVQLVNNDNSTAARDVHLQRLYETRSRVVHSGWAEVSAADVWNARCWTKEAAVKVLTSGLVGMTDDAYNGWFCGLPTDIAG